ncbi:MAG: IS256 family transposase [Proteobacteria bacterium]|nr:MAG: IS256 family transposase [Pseudomonadota bacterium]
MEIQSQEFAPFDLSKVQEKLKHVKSLEDLTGPGGPMQELMKQAVERILKAEQEDHLGYEPYQKTEQAKSNSRNGYSKKTVKTSSGPMELKIPRDRKGTFEPKLIEKYQTFDPDLEKKIIGMYSRGMSTRDIQSQLEEFYCTEVSPTLISTITDKVLEGVKEWQSRPLNDVYPVLFMDAIHYKIRQDGKVITKAAYTCMGINLDGKVDVLGLWIAEAEGAHFWLSVMSELKLRGVKDVLIACVDGLKGFPEAIATVFPKAQVQLCIVHQIRNSLRYVPYKKQPEFIADLKQVYRAPSLDVAEAELDQLEDKWKARAPFAVAGWRTNWINLSTYFAYPPPIRKMIYTTNAVEALHRQFRKVTKTKGSFPTDDALKKMLYLATLDLKASFHSKQGWPEVLGHLRIIFEDRIPQIVI